MTTPEATETTYVCEAVVHVYHHASADGIAEEHDLCGAEFTARGHTDRETDDAARGAGWTLDEGRWLCPLHEADTIPAEFDD